jgi:Spy/CpxP family protein refolding chaperone
MKSRIAVAAATLAIAVSAVGATAASAQAPTGTAGGGNCSTWASMKEAMFGVHCGFYMVP